MGLREIGSSLAGIALIAFAAVSTGCPVHHHVVIPAPSGPPVSYTHSFELSWSGDDLYAIHGLTVQHPTEIEVLDGGQIQTLALMLEVDVQAENHEALAAGFESDVRTASTLLSDSPVVKVPAQTCAESPGHLSGICVRKLQIFVPAFKRLPLELSWGTDARIDGLQGSALKLHLPAGGNTRIVNTVADVMIPDGGGPASNVFVDQLRGDGEDVHGRLTAHLATVNSMLLSSIGGRVTLYLDQHDQSVVRLDGTEISQFPYQSPDGN